MEWHISPLSSKSHASGERFAEDEWVVSLLIRSDDGEVLRIDFRDDEESSFSVPGETICRWSQSYKSRPDEDRARAESLKLYADSLFVSLFEGEDEPRLENAKLKHFLALMLERRRILRVRSRNEDFTRYLHRPTKAEYVVPTVELDPDFFIENEAKLSFLVGMEEESLAIPEAANR